MGKTIVLKESDYLELAQQRAYWQALFTRQRERFRDLQNQLKQVLGWTRRLREEQRAERRAHRQEIVALKRQMGVLAAENEKLKAQLGGHRRKMFAAQSERLGEDGQPKRPSREDALEQAPKGRRGKRVGSRGKGRYLRENLKREERILDLPNAEKACPKCGMAYARSKKSESSWTYEWRVQLVRVAVTRRRYLRVCPCEDCPKFKVAAGKQKPIAKGMFAANFLAKLLVYHFELQIPMNRLRNMLKMEGMGVSQGTLTGVLKKLHPLFIPLYREILARAQAGPRWHMDETTWRMLCDPSKKRWWLWVVSSPDCVCFLLDPKHSSKVPKAFFGQDAEGILSVDRFSAYKSLGGKILVAYCWAHVRRDFINATNYAKLKPWATGWLKRIAKLYRHNRERLRAEVGSRERGQAGKALQRQIEALERKWRRELEIKGLNPQRARILKSLKRHWEGLSLFVKCPAIPMDNNEAERCLRNAVVGRKIYYGSGAEWSGELTACMFSLLETLKKHGIDRMAFMNDYLEACATAGGKAPDDLSRFLPWHRSETRGLVA